MGIKNQNNIVLNKKKNVIKNIGYEQINISKEQLEKILNIKDLQNYSPAYNDWHERIPKDIKKIIEENDDFLTNVDKIHKGFIDLFIERDTIPITPTKETDSRGASLKTLQSSKYRDIWNDLVKKSIEEDKDMMNILGDMPFDFHLFQNINLRKKTTTLEDGSIVYSFKSSGAISLTQKDIWGGSQEDEKGVGRRFSDNMAFINIEGEIIDKGKEKICVLKELNLNGLRWSVLPVLDMHSNIKDTSDMLQIYQNLIEQSKDNSGRYLYRQKEIEMRYLGMLTLMQSKIERPSGLATDFSRDTFHTFKDIVYQPMRYQGSNTYDYSWKPNSDTPHIGYFGKMEDDKVRVYKQYYDIKQQKWIQEDTGKILDKTMFHRFKKYLDYEYKKEIGIIENTNNTIDIDLQLFKKKTIFEHNKEKETKKKYELKEIQDGD